MKHGAQILDEPGMDASRRKARVMVVDDHELLRVALKGLLENDPGLEVCGEAADADEAFRRITEERPDVVIVDVALKSGNGLDLVKRIKAKEPSIRLLVLSMYDSRLFAERALRAGASGYVNKQQPSEDILEAVRSVLNGDVYLSEAMTREILRRTSQGGEPWSQSPVENLSDRELEIFRLIGQGRATRQIASELHISTSTVETYRERLKTKLGLKNGAELSRKAMQWVMENG
jgi:DNA-binding NarL/FixJ family response regulator